MNAQAILHDLAGIGVLLNEIIGSRNIPVNSIFLEGLVFFLILRGFLADVEFTLGAEALQLVEINRNLVVARLLLGLRDRQIRVGAFPISIDVDRIDHYDPLDFWEPIPARPGRGVILDPGDFYILASKEAVTVPADHAAEMLAYDTLVGEFRVHYAGFFDPGFGLAESGGSGSRAVLEVRSHEVPFLIDGGQVVGRLVYEPLTARPDKLYGSTIGSSYQRQTLALGKQFRRPA